jgi:predicted nucleic acid-binding protein
MTCGRSSLVSAALARSPRAPSGLTLDAALDGRLELITSPLLLQEIATVLARPRLQKYLIALATANGAEAIVAGDLDLLTIEIITPRQLVDRLS